MHFFNTPTNVHHWMIILLIVFPKVPKMSEADDQEKIETSKCAEDDDDNNDDDHYHEANPLHTELGPQPLTITKAR